MTQRLGSSLFLCLVMGILAAAAAGCTSAGGTVPVAFPDNNVTLFTAPEADEIFPDDATDEDAGDDDAAEGEK